MRYDLKALGRDRHGGGAKRIRVAARVYRAVVAPATPLVKRTVASTIAGLTEKRGSSHARKLPRKLTVWNDLPFWLFANVGVRGAALDLAFLSAGDDLLLFEHVCCLGDAAHEFAMISGVVVAIVKEGCLQ